MSKAKNHSAQTPPSDLEKFLPNPHASMAANHATRIAINTEIKRLMSQMALLKVIRQVHDALQAKGIAKVHVCPDELDGLIQSLTNLGLCAEKVDDTQNLVVSIRKGA